MNTEPLSSINVELPRIGVVAGDERIAAVLARGLSARGWDIIEVRDPRSLLRRGDLERHDAVVAVLGSGDLEVFEMLAGLGRLEGAPPVVLLTKVETASALGPAILRELHISRMIAWPARVDVISRVLGQLCSGEDSGPREPPPPISRVTA